MANGESTVYRLQQLEERTKDHERRIRENREMLMALPYLTEDLADIKSMCGEIQKWVELREKERQLREEAREREAKEREREKEKLGLGWRIALLTTGGALVASLIAAATTLLGAAH